MYKVGQRLFRSNAPQQRLSNIVNKSCQKGFNNSIESKPFSRLSRRSINESQNFDRKFIMSRAFSTGSFYADDKKVKSTSLFSPPEIDQSKSLIDDFEVALDHRFKRTKDAIKSGINPLTKDRYIYEALRSLLIEDPIINFGKKPFVSWFKTLEINSIEDLTLVFNQFAKELEISFTAHPVNYTAESTEQRVMSECQRLHQQLEDLNLQYNGAKSNGNIYAQQRVTDQINRVAKEYSMRLNELANSDPTRDKKMGVDAEWAKTFNSSATNAAKTIEDRIGRAEFLVKDCVIEKAAELLLNSKRLDKESADELREISNRLRSNDRISQLINNKSMRMAYPELMNDVQNYTLNIKFSRWIGDGDGHPGVDAKVVRNTCMLICRSTLNPLLVDGVSYRMGLEQSLLTVQEENRLKAFAKSKQTPKLNDITSDLWNKAQLLSMHINLILNNVKLDDKSNKLDEFPFKMLQEFIEGVKLLADIEKYHQMNGKWFELNQKIESHGIFGSPIGRKGHADIVSLLTEIAEKLNIQFQTLSDMLLELRKIEELSEKVVSRLEEYSIKNQELFNKFFTLSKLDPAMVIQSDSPADIDVAMNTMKALSHATQLNCPMTLLFEDRDSMEVCIQYIKRLSKEECQIRFENCIIMSAGSDNQKKSTFMLSDPLNIELANLCYDKGIPFKFGRGDCEARSRRLGLYYTNITVQPGTMSRFTNGLVRAELLLKYLFSIDDESVAIQKNIGSLYYQEYMTHLDKQHELSKLYKSLDMSSNSFSRPSTKGNLSENPVEFFESNLRAIDGARRDLISGSLNRVFPNNPAERLKKIIEQQILEIGLNWEEVHRAYRNERFQSVMEYYYMIRGGEEVKQWSDDYPEAYTVTKEDVASMYELLTGQSFTLSEHYKERGDALTYYRNLYVQADDDSKRTLILMCLELV